MTLQFVSRFTPSSDKLSLIICLITCGNFWNLWNLLGKGRANLNLELKLKDFEVFLSSPFACVACERLELLKTAIDEVKMEVIYKLCRTRCYFGELCSIYFWYLWYVYLLDVLSGALIGFVHSPLV